MRVCADAAIIEAVFPVSMRLRRKFTRSQSGDLNLEVVHRNMRYMHSNKPISEGEGEGEEKPENDVPARPFAVLMEVDGAEIQFQLEVAECTNHNLPKGSWYIGILLK